MPNQSVSPAQVTNAICRVAEVLEKRFTDHIQLKDENGFKRHWIPSVNKVKDDEESGTLVTYRRKLSKQEVSYSNLEITLLTEGSQVLGCSVPDNVVVDIGDIMEIIATLTVLNRLDVSSDKYSEICDYVRTKLGKLSPLVIAYHNVYNLPKRTCVALQILAFSQGYQGLHYAFVIGLPKSDTHAENVLVVSDKPITVEMVFHKFSKLYTNTGNTENLIELNSIDTNNGVMEISTSISTEELERLENQPNN